MSEFEKRSTLLKQAEASFLRAALKKAKGAEPAARTPSRIRVEKEMELIFLQARVRAQRRGQDWNIEEFIVLLPWL